MTITQEQIDFLNKINSGAQKVDLGNLIAEMEHAISVLSSRLDEYIATQKNSDKSKS